MLRLVSEKIQRTMQTVVPIGKAPNGWESPSTGRIGFNGIAVCVRIKSPSFTWNPNELSNQSDIFSTYLICGHLPAQVGAIASHHNLGVPQRVILQHCYPGVRVNIHLMRNVKLVHLSSRTVPSLGQSAGNLSQSTHLNICLLPPPTPSITFKY